MQNRSMFKRRMRYRSSSNAEDSPNFNGAGLYKSNTGIQGDSIKTPERAIKKVWASLWSYRAFMEREAYSIKQSSTSMGILVHRSFPDEKVNGVAVTAHIFDSTQNALYINVKKSENSVVRPEDNSRCDEIILGLPGEDESEDYMGIEYLNNNTFSENYILNQEQLFELKQALEKVKQHFYNLSDQSIPYHRFAVEVEFKFDKRNRLYIKQARMFPGLR